jgi:hypothetical protein
VRRASPDDDDPAAPAHRPRVTRLATPPVRRVAPDGVFDAFGWCQSDHLEWRRPHEGSRRWDPSAPVDSSAPERMVFVLRRPCDFLPTEFARLHATGLGLGDELALAPWGIDAATDGFFEHRVPPGGVLWLAADNLNALFWGLHDWAHFHNHGPFDDRAWTELQCDAAALVWLWVNREAVGLSGAMWERVRLEAVALSTARFASHPNAGAELDAAALPLLDAPRVRALAAESPPPPASAARPPALASHRDRPVEPSR